MVTNSAWSRVIYSWSTALKAADLTKNIGDPHYPVHKKIEVGREESEVVLPNIHPNKACRAIVAPSG